MKTYYAAIIFALLSPSIKAEDSSDPEQIYAERLAAASRKASAAEAHKIQGSKTWEERSQEAADAYRARHEEALRRESPAARAEREEEERAAAQAREAGSVAPAPTPYTIDGAFPTDSTGKLLPLSRQTPAEQGVVADQSAALPGTDNAAASASVRRPAQAQSAALSKEAEQLAGEKQQLVRVLSGERADGIVVAKVSAQEQLAPGFLEREAIQKAEAELSDVDRAQRKVSLLMKRYEQLSAEYEPILAHAELYTKHAVSYYSSCAQAGQDASAAEAEARSAIRFNESLLEQAKRNLTAAESQVGEAQHQLERAEILTVVSDARAEASQARGDAARAASDAARAQAAAGTAQTELDYAKRQIEQAKFFNYPASSIHVSP